MSVDCILKALGTSKQGNDAVTLNMGSSKANNQSRGQIGGKGLGKGPSSNKGERL